jgi:hypothetical protein
MKILQNSVLKFCLIIEKSGDQEVKIIESLNLAPFLKELHTTAARCHRFKLSGS